MKNKVTGGQDPQQVGPQNVGFSTALVVDGVDGAQSNACLLGGKSHCDQWVSVDSSAA